MKTQGKINEQKSDKELFDRFIKLVQDRQWLENIYYDTGDRKMLAKIEDARERIRDVLRGMGIKV